MIAAGIDIGNSTTEVMIAKQENGKTSFLGYATAPTTGLKGTTDNVAGVLEALAQAQKEAGEIAIDQIFINETAPVVSRLSSDVSFWSVQHLPPPASLPFGPPPFPHGAIRC